MISETSAQNMITTWAVIALYSAIMLIEIVGGSMLGSLALVADDEIRAWKKMADNRRDQVINDGHGDRPSCGGNVRSERRPIEAGVRHVRPSRVVRDCAMNVRIRAPDRLSHEQVKGPPPPANESV